MASPSVSLAMFAGLLSVASAGCSGDGPLRSRWMSMNSLQANVARLETDNQRLERELADSKANMRRFEDKLVNAEEVNGELRARLDDARYALKGQGVDLDGQVSRRTNPPRSSKTLPAGRPKVPGRKAPFATIPGRIDSTEPPQDDSEPSSSSPSSDETDPDRTSYRWRPAGAEEKRVK